MFKKNLMILSLMVILLPSAFAEQISDYQCSNYSGNRTAFIIEKVGLGTSKGSTDAKYITFCWKADPESWCYASNNLIDTPAGKADYATLLTALTTGRKVGFYCEPGGYAQNIHIQK